MAPASFPWRAHFGLAGPGPHTRSVFPCTLTRKRFDGFRTCIASYQAEEEAEEKEHEEIKNTKKRKKQTRRHEEEEKEKEEGAPG